MAGLNMRCSVFAFAFAMAMIFLLAPSHADGDSDSQCDWRDALTQLYNVTVPCSNFIDKDNVRSAGNEDPPAECCDAIKKVDLACLCANIPSVFEEYASMDNFVFAAGKCDPESLKPVSRCGTYSVGWSDSGAYADKGSNTKE